MTDKNIFCNSPWYELHIYWDGSLGFCCQEAHKLYDDFAQDMERDFFMSAAEAVEYGLADRVIHQRDI